MKIPVRLLILMVAFTLVPNVQVIHNTQATELELHPKVVEALSREVLPEGFIFDVQSSDLNYYRYQLDYILKQIDAIYDRSTQFRIILLSRGREIRSMITAEYDGYILQKLLQTNKSKSLEVLVDIEVAAALGFNEDSFPNFIEVQSNSYLTIVASRAAGMIVIELQRMSVDEQELIKISPTWRTDKL